MPSFDIVSQVNSMEIENAVNQAKKFRVTMGVNSGRKKTLTASSDEGWISIQIRTGYFAKTSSSA